MNSATLMEDEPRITDVYCKSIMNASWISVEESPLSDYEKLQQEHRAALEALRKLAEGVRIVTRQMKQQHNDDNDSVMSGASDTTPPRGRTFSNGTVSTCSVVSEDDRRIDDLTQSLDGVVGADLLGLSQAAQMVHEHARLASQEASILTDDMALAASTAHEALERAMKAEQAVIRLHREKTTLQQRLEQLLVERRILGKEIKSMRKENATLKKYHQDSKRQEMAFALEQHVRGALLIHEQQLAAANRNKRAESWDYTDEVSGWKPEECSPEEATEVEHAIPVEPQPAFVVIDQAENAKPKHNIKLPVGFGGAGLAGLGYKFNRKIQPLKIYRTVKEHEAPAETAATDATTDAGVPNEISNKESLSKESSVSNVGRNIMGDLTTASTTFANFFSSRTKEPSTPVLISHLHHQSASLILDNEPSLTIHSEVPPSVFTNAPSVPSPFAEDSPITSSKNRFVDYAIECDEQVLRSLSLPEDESRMDDKVAAFPSITNSGLYEA